MYEFNKIAVIGLGYVGLPLCLRFAEAGISVIGLDVDVDKTVKINDGKSYINHISEDHIKSALETGRLEASIEFNRISEVQAVIICVPTPLNKHRALVFMTYLNDVEDGGTEFLHQNVYTPAKKGLTLIWPAYWTHTHRGVVSKLKEKYIVTGWINFINQL